MNKTKISVKRIPFLITALFAATILLCACSEIKLKTSDNKDVLVQIDNSSCSRQEALFLLMEEKAYYEQGQQQLDALWEKPAGSLTLGEYVKDVIKDKLIRYTGAAILSDRLAAYPTDEAKAKAQDEAVTAWSKISGLYNMSEYGITAEIVHDLYDKKAVYDAVYEKITTDAAVDVTEENTRVMLADYTVVPGSVGEDAVREVWKAVSGGKDFKEACDEAGYTLLTSQVIKRGDLPSDIDNIAFALRDGELSEVIEGKDGFYIIRCLDDNLLTESAANYNLILSNTKEEAFKEAWYEFSKESKLSFDDSYWKKLDIGSIR